MHFDLDLACILLYYLYHILHKHWVLILCTPTFESDFIGIKFVVLWRWTFTNIQGFTSLITKASTLICNTVIILLVTERQSWRVEQQAFLHTYVHCKLPSNILFHLTFSITLMIGSSLFGNYKRCYQRSAVSCESNVYYLSVFSKHIFRHRFYFLKFRHRYEISLDSSESIRTSKYINNTNS